MLVAAMTLPTMQPMMTARAVSWASPGGGNTLIAYESFAATCSSAMVSPWFREPWFYLGLEPVASFPRVFGWLAPPVEEIHATPVLDER